MIAVSATWPQNCGQSPEIALMKGAGRRAPGHDAAVLQHEAKRRLVLEPRDAGPDTIQQRGRHERGPRAGPAALGEEAPRAQEQVQ